MRGPGRAGPSGSANGRRGLAARRGGGRGAAVGGRSPVRSSHDGAQLRAAARPLLRLLGPRGHRRALVRAQGAEPRGDHHDAGHHRRVLLPILAHRHPGPGQPPVRAAAEERDHLVRALPLGVSSPWELAPQQRPPSNPLPSCSCSSLYPPVPNSHQRCWTEAGPTAQAHLEHCSLDQWTTGPPSTAGSIPGQGPTNPALGAAMLPGRDPFCWPRAAVTGHHPVSDLCVVPADPAPAVLVLPSWCVQP